MNTVTYKQNKRRQAGSYDETETAINVGDDYMRGEHDKLISAHRNIDELLASGSNIIGSLRDQRGMLTGVQRRMGELANTLGLSSSIMGLIEKRIYSDKIILFGGMFIFTACILLFMYYLW